MIKNLLFACLCLSFFNGCVSITKELPAYKTYSINTDEKATKKLSTSIYVKEPKVIPSLNSKAIYYSKSSNLEKYALSKFSDKPSKMIQEQLASFFSKSTYISTSNIKSKATYTIFSEISSFQQVFKNNTSYAKFNIRIYVKNNDSKKLFYKNFDYEIKCPSNDAKGAITGLNDTLSHFLKDMELHLEKILKNDVAKRNK